MKSTMKIYHSFTPIVTLSRNCCPYFFIFKKRTIVERDWVVTDSVTKGMWPFVKEIVVVL